MIRINVFYFEIITKICDIPNNNNNNNNNNIIIIIDVIINSIGDNIITLTISSNYTIGIIPI